MPVTRRTRFEVLRRDGNRCRYCGATSDEARMTVDHVLPVALGGGDDPSNLVAACVDCNAGKTSTGPGEHLVAQVSDDAVRWAQAMKAAAAEVATQADALRTAVELVRDEWIRQAAWPSRERLPDSYASSVERILTAGLPVEVMLDMVRVAQTTKYVENRWSYFAGCCWKQVTRLQERAREIATADAPTDPWAATDGGGCAPATCAYIDYVYADEGHRLLANVIDVGYTKTRDDFLEFVPDPHYIWAA